MAAPVQISFGLGSPASILGMLTFGLDVVLGPPPPIHIGAIALAGWASASPGIQGLTQADPVQIANVGNT